MSAEPMIVVDRLVKDFGDVRAVDDITLEIPAGEFFSMLGPSGCGKTTTLRVIAGFEEADSGRVLLDGKDVTWVSPKKRNVNMVFQDYALFPHMTVSENVAFGLKLRRVDRSEIASRVAEMLTVVRLDGYEDRRPAALSGGQRQRVALARALVNRPAALLLDEPLGALDLKLRREMQLELKRIQQSTGTTFVYVTHDQEEALTMSDRIAVMDGGVVQQVDEPKALYERPATSFVADFIGTSNNISITGARRRRRARGDGPRRGHAHRRARLGQRDRLPDHRAPGEDPHRRRGGRERVARARERSSTRCTSARSRRPWSRSHGGAADRPRAQRRRATRPRPRARASC